MDDVEDQEGEAQQGSKDYRYDEGKNGGENIRRFGVASFVEGYDVHNKFEDLEKYDREKHKRKECEDTEDDFLCFVELHDSKPG